MASKLMEQRQRILLTTPHVETASGSTASFSTDMSAPLKSCMVTFSPVQDTSGGNPSPVNICPVSGHTGLTGRNTENIPLSFDWTGSLGTIYGGYVDLVTGSFTQTHVYETLNTRNWNVSGTNAYQWGHSRCLYSNTDYKKSICTHWLNTTFGNEYFVGLNNNGAMYIGGNFWNAVGITPTNEAIKNYFSEQVEAGTPLYVCAELVTPIVHQISSQTIRAISQENAFWFADTDTVEVEYWTH